MGNLMKRPTRHDAELRGTHAEQGPYSDIDKREQCAKNGNDGHGHHLVLAVALGFLFAGRQLGSNAHDRRRTANARAGCSENGQVSVNTKASGQIVGKEDGARDHHARQCNGLHARLRQGHKIELEAKQDNACSQKLVRDERDARLGISNGRLSRLTHNT